MATENRDGLQVEGHLLSIVIPVRDEANYIGDLISRIRASMNGHKYEIIVVNDGSKDGTEDILVNYGTLVISHPENLGKGAAMKSGVARAAGDIIIFMDGDGAHEPQDITRLVEPILEHKADMVIGSRVLPESKVIVSPYARRLCNKLASFVISALISFPLTPSAVFKVLARNGNNNHNNDHSSRFNNGSKGKWIRITDCTSGLRAITRDSWQKLALVSRGFQIETEMIYEAARNKLTITEVPISCNWDNHFSHLSVFKDGLKTVRLLAKKVLGTNGTKGS
ncbi:MAG: glycosyltransferase family 2 protein [Promethearchaeota archaeon]